MRVLTNNQSDAATACLIGVSGYGATHYHALLRQVELGQMRLLGATVINQDQETEKCRNLRELGCELFSDHRAMLQKYGAQTDLCCIPTGIHLHAPMTLDALRAGANVLVEKPAAATIQDVRAMQACERETDRFVAVGYQTMYVSETPYMKQAILDGAIGTVQSIKCKGLWPRFDSYYARNLWAGRLKHGEHWVLDSPFNNALGHQLNLICFFAGTEFHRSAKLQTVEAELYRGHDIESTDTACLRMMTTENIPLLFIVTHCSEEQYGPDIVVRGDKGLINWNAQGAYLQTEDGARKDIPCHTGSDLRNAVFDRLHQRIHDPSAFICDLSIAGTQTLCVNAAHESSAISTIDAKLIQRIPTDKSVKTVIDGIDEIIARAFDEEKLFSELQVGWAQPGRVVNVENYHTFSQPRTL